MALSIVSANTMPHNPATYEPWFVKLGVAALVAGAAVALWHFSPSLKSLAPGGTLKSYEDSEEWPKWSDEVDEGWDDGGNDVDDGFGSVELTRHESQTAYGYGSAPEAANATGIHASNDVYDEGHGSNAGRFFDGWPRNHPQGEEPTPAFGYGDGSGTASFDDGWADEETSPQTTTTTTIHFYPPLPAIGKYINHYKASNPLNIEVKSSRSENYFLILGDWGKAGGPGSCQLAVATRMRAYVKEQKLRGKHLLFIASVGDNFYWTGATPEAWERTWSQPYGVHDPSSPLYQIPWLSLYGNHDFGNNDPHAFCPHLYPRKILHGQPYSSHQLNRDKFPDRPHFTEKYWLPDYNYHYELPAADLEVIVVDTNGKVTPDIIGGDQGGRNKADANCSGQAISQDFLEKIAQSGEDLVIERAKQNTAGTILLLQHYPGKFPRETFENALPASRKEKVKVLCAYGHEHTQGCEKKDKSGMCIDILTGGGGGCCGPIVDLAGFTAVHLDSGFGASVDVESSSVRLPAGSCKW